METNLLFTDFIAITTIIIALQAFAIGLIYFLNKKQEHHSKDKCYQNNHTHNEIQYNLNAITEVLIELARILEIMEDSVFFQIPGLPYKNKMARR